MITVLLVEDSEVMRKAILNLLKDYPEVQMLGAATSFAETMQTAATLRPQVVILDVHMHDEEGTTPAQVKSCLVGSRVLAISVWKDEETKALAESYGAVALPDKANLAAELIPAIKRSPN